MKTISVKAVKRDEYGKKAAKAVRREGMVPCVLSGNGESVSFSVDPREIKALIYTPNSYIVEFDFDGKKEQAVLREAQFHPIREQILHLDFYRIAEGKPVSIAIPVRLTGNAEGVKVGGKLTLSARARRERAGREPARRTGRGRNRTGCRQDHLRRRPCIREPEIRHSGFDGRLRSARNPCIARCGGTSLIGSV